mgnify:CR=1 FL=1
MNDKAVLARGRRARREVLGADQKVHEDRFSEPFREFTTRYVWGEIWTRKGLPRKTRCLVNIALLTAMRCTDGLKMHIRGARKNGCTEEEIREVLMQAAVYCGVPVVRAAVNCASEVFASEPPRRRKSS